MQERVNDQAELRRLMAELRPYMVKRFHFHKWTKWQVNLNQRFTQFKQCVICDKIKTRYI